VIFVYARAEELELGYMAEGDWYWIDDFDDEPPLSKYEHDEFRRRLGKGDNPVRNQSLRRLALKRDQGVCASCGKHCLAQADEGWIADHIIPAQLRRPARALEHADHLLDM
jgi:5-methylcytosine-specific restriction endonuclease McrA